MDSPAPTRTTVAAVESSAASRRLAGAAVSPNTRKGALRSASTPGSTLAGYLVELHEQEGEPPAPCPEAWSTSAEVGGPP